MNNGISVIICCYNSAALLPQTLLHIARQKVKDGLNWEVIIVDNASTDNTSFVAETEWKKYNAAAVDFKVVKELTPGLLKARIKGYSEARYEFLLYCDDDNWLNEHYVENAYRVLNENANIGICGGKGIPVFEIDKPGWFKGLILDGFALGRQAAIDEGPVSDDRFYVYGAGMVIRKSAIAIPYSPLIVDSLMLSGRKGNALSAGDDAEVSFFVLLKGYKLWYCDKLDFNHYIQAKRLNKKYVSNLYKGFGKTIPYLNIYHSNFPFITSKQKFFYSSWFFQVFFQLYKAGTNFLMATFKSDRWYISVMHFEAVKQLFKIKKDFKKLKYDICKLVTLVSQI